MEAQAAADKHFELILTNRLKLLLVLLPGIGLLMLALIITMDWLACYLYAGKLLRVAGALAVGAGGGYPLYRLAVKVSGEPTRFAIGPDQLTVVNRSSGAAYRWPYADIAAYRFGGFQSNAVLRLRLRNGSKVRFFINDVLHGRQNFAGLVRQLEVALGKHQKSSGAAEVLREPTFFEKPVSTLVLLAFAGVLAWMTWEVMAHNKPLRGGFYGAYGGFLAYLVAWYDAREQRRRPG